MHLKHHDSIHFGTPNPLDDGLGDDIQAEQHETEAITLEEHPDEQSLEKYWQFVEEDISKDPEWFNFAGDE